MSRTDKDRPWWIRNHDETDGLREVHDHRARWKWLCDCPRPWWAVTGGRHRIGEGTWGWSEGECEIDSRVDDGRKSWRVSCYRERIDRLSFYGSASREWRRARYWGPERAADRAIHRNLVKDWNTFGDCDDSAVQLNQHRHATFGGGWWD